MPHANIILLGQVGAGKSSFCNTVNSAFIGNITQRQSAYKLGIGGSTTVKVNMSCMTKNNEASIREHMNMWEIITNKYLN